MILQKRLPFLTALSLALWLCCGASAQTLSLEECRKAARENGRAAYSESITGSEYQERENIIKSKYRPELSVVGETHYQSDAPDPSGITDFPFELYKLDQFQYHAGVLLTQSVYRGGTLKLNKELNAIDREIEDLQNESFYLELENSVDEVFLDIILAGKEIDIAKAHRDALQIKLDDARSAFEQGIGYRSDILSLEAAISEADANLAAYFVREDAGRAVLAEITGLEISDKTELQLPFAGLETEFSDPAFGLIDLQSRRLDAMKKLETAKTLPSLNAFGTVGYGLWSLNMFNRDPQFYEVVGLTLKIPITSWSETNSKNKIYSYQNEKLQIQKDAMTRRRNAEKIKYDGEIERIDALMASSAITIEKFEALCNELDNMKRSGVSSQSEYLEAMKKLSAARISFEM